MLLLFILGSSTRALCTDSLQFRALAVERQVMDIHDDVLKASLLMKKSRLYKSAAKYNEAFTSLQRIDIGTLEPLIKDSIHYEKAFNLFMLGSFPEALQELWSMRDVHSLGEPSNVLYMMVLLENQHWNDFRQEYLRSAVEKNIDTTGFHAAFRPPVVLDADRYDRLAKIPWLGLGLFRSGYSTRGFTSASLQIIMTGIGVWQIATGFYFTGVFSGLFPAWRFYNGGRILTTSMVSRTNAKRIADVKQTGYSFVGKLE